jgi:predicted transcriptional regulator
MDNLAREAMLARQARMTYGRWKAMQKPVQIEKKAIPDGWLVCQNCGKPFKPTSKRAQKFCEVLCQKEAYAEKLRQRNTKYMREYRARKGEET